MRILFWVSAVVAAACGITVVTTCALWSRRVDRLIGQLPERKRTADLQFGFMQIRAMELAAKGNDPQLAADMRKLFGIMIAAFVLLAAALVAAIVIGTIKWR